jgi:hypothetical protein
MRRKNDILWKGILEKVFDDLLRFIFPDAEKELDLRRGFEFLDKELNEMYPHPDRPSQTRFVDKLVKAYRKDGLERWMLVHIEIQGEKDPHFARRMFQYYYRILDRYDRPVTAIAIFTGRDSKKMPDRFEDHCMGTHQVYQYNTLRIADYPDEDLSASENPFALVLLAAKKALLTGKNLDKELLKQKLLVAKLLYSRGLFTKPKIQAVLSFLHNYIRFDKPQTNLIFTYELDRITQQKNTMDIFEQVAELRAEEATKEALKKERAKTVKKLLTHTELSMEKIASIVGVTVYFVRKMRQGLR